MFIPFLPVKIKDRGKTPASKAVFSNAYFFKWGRQAMRVGLDSLSMVKGKSILMPASMCPAVLSPVVNYGLRVSLYGLNLNMRWDINEIAEKILPDTTAVYVIHYFGIATDLTELKALCAQKGIALIEDCALCGVDPGSSLAKSGDISIFSLWKFYPVTDGAILYRNGKNAMPVDDDRHEPGLCVTLKRSMEIMCKDLGMRGLFPMEYIKKRQSNNRSAFDGPEDITPGEDYPVFLMSSGAKRTFLRTDHKSIAEKRRENFRQMIDFSMENGFTPLFKKLTPGSVPYCFPIIVDDPVQTQWRLTQSGIQTEIPVNKPFKGMPYLLPNTGDLSAVTYLAEHVLGLPIHQDIEERQLTFIKQKMRDIR